MSTFARPATYTTNAGLFGMKQKLLIVEDQFIEANNLKLILTTAGYRVCTIAASVHAALAIVESESPDLVLIDIILQGELTGIDLAHRLRQKGVAFVFLSANSDKRMLEAAKITEPYGFLVKPFRKKDVLIMLDIAWYLHQIRQNPVTTQKSNSRPPIAQVRDVKKLLGDSPAMQESLLAINTVAPSDISVLILGESGTGKELAAQYIHQLSFRHAKPFVVVNCAALPANLVESELFGHERGAFTGATDKRIGKFEEADGGTIFLDEIGELPIDLQAKLLRVLQEREIEPVGGKKKRIDVRVMAATNRDLEEEVANGQFRIDLFYRLNVFPVTMPPLRERGKDVLLLAQHFIQQYAEQQHKQITGLSEDVKRLLLEYSWPGNVRQLENVMIRSVLLTRGDQITQVDLPLQYSRTGSRATSSTKSIQENERDYIIGALEKCGWKLYGPGGAAELLDINASTLSSRMRKLGIEKRKNM
ncbi:sigma-54-dependent transcriptional regulator [Paraflavitalea pollutisoli]|uniref:sigma-54-dependent transcriptional regulator n=1 Tax=Paraflavitalea pollutisoli TaxID=3034143 RepID=UPI0023EB0260|nr:sigma-54 dependent transcriptional regulator [Paraflavitalea sp. H1-2-19X]